MVKPTDAVHPTLEQEYASGNWNTVVGINLRTELAARAMQGLLTNRNGLYPDDIAERAVNCADALIAELNKTSENE